MPFSTGNSPPGLPALAPLAAAMGGNRCGHVPSAPRFTLALPPDANPARPALIVTAIAKLRRYYDTPRDGRWDALSQGERHARLARRLSAAGGAGTEAGRRLADRLTRWRQQRSERREALVAVLALLLAYTDIATLTVAVPAGGGWLGLSAPWIAAHTALSPSRVKRALATLTRCGLLAATGQGRRFDRRRRCWIGVGWGPVRRLSFHLIRALGLDVAWERARRKARRRPAAVTTAPAPPAFPALPPLNPSSSSSLIPPTPTPAERFAAQRDHVRNLRRQLRAPAARAADTDPAVRQADQERTRRLAALAVQGLSPAEIRRLLSDASQPP